MARQSPIVDCTPGPASSDDQRKYLCDSPSNLVTSWIGPRKKGWQLTQNSSWLPKDAAGDAGADRKRNWRF